MTPIAFYSWQLFALALVSAQPASEKISWGQCDQLYIDISSVPIECGTLIVPLDYTDPNNNRTHILDVIKTRAQGEHFKGTIVLSFGGPGVNAFANFVSSIPVMRKLTGDQHDLVTFDQRGADNRGLRFSCYDSDEERLLATSPHPLCIFPESSDTAIGRLWAEGKGLADRCFEKMKDIGEFVGTASTARDVMQIVDALDETPLLNFYGMSYGSALGTTIAAMFPERIGSMVLDANLNPHEYYNSFVNPEMVTDADAAFTAFLSECIAAGSAQCALASTGLSALDLEITIRDLIESTKYNPIPFPPETSQFDALWGGSVLDFSAFKNMIALALYSPTSFPVMASGLAGLMQGNMTAMAAWRKLLSGARYGFEVEALQGIRCSDHRKRATSVEEVLPEIEEARRISWYGGNAAFDHSMFTMPCANWRFDAKERYEGNFQVKTRNPVLLVGTTYDPVTPMVSARNVSATFEGSAVLEVKGFGHVTTAHPSECANKIMRDYFANAVLLEPVMKCEPDQKVFDLSKG
ncbi:hypothetical protein LTR17_000789 [Elasticomyces elasticus]|nr:hypothetical protein LTR17_000789 [Elasticomyces elasticus]